MPLAGIEGSLLDELIHPLVDLTGEHRRVVCGHGAPCPYDLIRCIQSVLKPFDCRFLNPPVSAGHFGRRVQRDPLAMFYPSLGTVLER
jgi:hypothetical protein